MTRARALLGSALFLLIAPGVVAGFIPYWLTHWRTAPPLFGVGAAPIAGAILIAFGVALLLECFFRFAWNGRGTPAPVAPTERLVVSGFYQYVRNPMYFAVTALNLGQALLFASAPMFAYTLLVWAAFHAFVLLYEEPTLRERYGEEYEAYARNVPRWLPRLTPWRG